MLRLEDQENHPYRPNLTSPPVPKRKLKFKPQVSTQELAQELPFSEEPGKGPWDTPSERVESIKKAVKRRIRKKPTDAAKKKAESLARTPWIGKRGKPRNGTDPETPSCSAIPTEATTTLATRGQAI